MEVLDHVLWKSSIEENLLYVFDDGRSLRGRLEDYGVAGEESRYQRVDENEVGILPLLAENNDDRLGIRTFHANSIRTGPTGNFLM